MPKVSVIIPVYNVEKYLRECLDSVINQTLRDIEIICINDGSTDNSLEILKKYAQKDNRIVLINKENEGAGEARNKGLEKAQGDFVIFFDSDDYMATDCLEKLINKAQKVNADITICRSYRFDDGKDNFTIMNWAIKDKFLPQATFCPKEIPSKVFQFCVGWPWDKLYKREFVVNNNLKFQNLRHSNDTFFVLFSLCCATSITIIQDALVYHRLNSGSLAATRVKRPDCFYFALKELLKNLKKRKYYEKYKQSFINYCIEFPFWHITTINNEQCQKKMVHLLSKIFVEIKIKKYPKEYFYDYNAYNILNNYINKYKFKPFKTIFSIRNADDGTHKILTILGIKIRFRRRVKNAEG